MSQWVDRFEEHAAHGQLQNYKEKLNEIEEQNTEAQSPEATENIERLKQIGSQVESVFSTTDPFLTPVGPLNTINQQLAQAIAQCSQFQDNGNVGHLTNANNNADAVLLQLNSLPSIRTTEDLGSLNEAIISLRQSVGQHNRYVNDERESIQSQIEEAKKELENLEANVTANETRLDEVVSEFQRQFSESDDRSPFSVPLTMRAFVRILTALTDQSLGLPKLRWPRTLPGSGSPTHRAACSGYSGYSGYSGPGNPRPTPAPPLDWQIPLCRVARLACG